MHPVSDCRFNFHQFHCAIGAITVSPFSVRRSYNVICLKQLNVGRYFILVYFRDTSVSSLIVLFEIFGAEI